MMNTYKVVAVNDNIARARVFNNYNEAIAFANVVNAQIVKIFRKTKVWWEKMQEWYLEEWG